MNNRPTPETDAACGYALTSHYGPSKGIYLSMDKRGPFVHTEVARKLERERDEANDKMVEAECRVREIASVLEKVKHERDEAREAAAKWESSSDAMERAGAEQARRADENREWALKAERERDELQKAINGLCEHFKIIPSNTTLLAVELLKIERERDEANDKMVEAECRVREIASVLKRVKRERDEAIRLLKLCADHTITTYQEEAEEFLKQLEAEK